MRKQLTLREWAESQPIKLNTGDVLCWIGDSSHLVNRSQAWNLSDYLVSQVSAGTIWFYPRGDNGRQGK